MPEGTTVSTGEGHHEDGPLTLRIQRMNADRLVINVDSPQVVVEALKEKIRHQTNIPVERQRIIFRGRVLKNGERLSHYDIQDESVLHLVERPETGPSVPPASETGANATRNMTDGNDNNGSSGRRPGLAGATANILLHTMQVDPSAGPAVMAQEISRSVMEALRGVIDGVGTEEGSSFPGALLSSLFGSPPTAAGGNFGQDNGTAAPTATAAADENAHTAANSGRFDPFAPSPSIFSTGGTVGARSLGSNVFAHPMSVIPPLNNPPISTNADATVHNNMNPLPATTGTHGTSSSRLLSRPTSVIRTQVAMDPAVISSPSYAAAASQAASTIPSIVSLPGNNHQTVRTDPRRALQNLNEELSRLTTFANGSDVFPSTTYSVTAPSAEHSNGDRIDDISLLISNLEHFERAYWMLASGCRELRDSLRRDRTTVPVTTVSTPPVLPWDRLANLMALLHELPLLMVSQRRLLSSLRAVPPHGSIELPPSLDVPSFLARETGGTVNNGGDRTDDNTSHRNGGITIAAALNPMNMIEPPE